MSGASSTPGRDCPLCPRLKAFRDDWRQRQPGWFNAPVPSFGPLTARLLITGLAPGLQGANRTGRPFTGDYAGDLLYATLAQFGFTRGNYAARPDDGLELVDARIANAVSCVPPENKPTGGEIATCRRFPRGRHRGNAEPARHRDARAHRAREHCRGARRQAIGCAVRPWPRREHRCAQGVQQLSLLALQHQHRRADAGDVPRVFAKCARISTKTDVCA